MAISMVKLPHVINGEQYSNHVYNISGTSHYWLKLNNFSLLFMCIKRAHQLIPILYWFCITVFKCFSKTFLTYSGVLPSSTMKTMRTLLLKVILCLLLWLDQPRNTNILKDTSFINFLSLVFFGSSLK